MDWTADVDIYCERLAPGLFAEPINLVTNLSFVIAAFVVWPKVKHDVAGRILAFVIVFIGICSALFHSLANVWSELADQNSILVFILIYVFFASRRILSSSRTLAIVNVFGFVPYAAATAIGLNALVGPVNGSVAYFPVLILIAVFGICAFKSHKPTAIGLFIGVGIFTLSLTFRSFDQRLCASWPTGTHFIWHSLNGVLLGWMTLVMARIPTR